MTSSLPDEALHFRGKTLTPESPRPLHVAEPANIPVLQHQMDPVFNDTSTYDHASSVESGQPLSVNVRPPAHGLSTQSSGSEDVRKENIGPRQVSQNPGSFHSGPSQVDDGSMNKNDTSVSTPVKDSVPSSRSSPGETSAARVPANPSLTAVDADSAPPLGQTTADGPSHAPQGISAANHLDNAASNWPAQPTPSDRLDTQHHGNVPNSREGGVDFQNLLDNLPPPSSTAPSAPAASEAIASAVDDSAPQAAYDESAQTQASLGLPPRPPPQEKPSIHPNYDPSDDIRSYHHLPPHTSSTPTSYSQQDSNHLPYITAAPPGTSSGTNNLPPPPIASFQQPPTSGTASQEPAGQLSPKKDGPDRQAGRPLKGTEDDIPWGREVQRKYDEFLHEERIYVTEGLWDRFPPGSRLFVGPSSHSLSPPILYLTCCRQSPNRAGHQEGPISHIP